MSMDRSEVKAIVEREAAALADTLGVGHWKIRVCYERSSLGGEFAGDCSRLAAYDKATITIDPAQHDDEAEVIDTLRHELFHVVLAPFDVLFSHLRIGLEGKELEQAQGLWHFAAEQAVICLERMHRGLTKAAPELKASE